MSDSIQRIIDGTHNKDDLETLRQLLDSDSLKTTLQLGEDNINIDRQILVQIGKYNINIGKGEDIQIGDIYYPELNSEAIQTILEHLFQNQKKTRRL